MEKYSQFRDKGTSIAPFFPTSPPSDGIAWMLIKVPLFLIRLPVVFFLSIFTIIILENLPGIGSSIKNGATMSLLFVAGVLWVDLQVDGVKRGSLGRSPQRNHLPTEGTIVASSFTSPLDPLYLAGIFHPIFTRSYPGTRKVEQISLLRAILLAFSTPVLTPPASATLVTLRELKEKHPESIICVFPECTTSNGRAILEFSPSLLTAGAETKIFPVSIRYAPGDIATPVSGGRIQWLWRLLSRTAHTIRVRIAAPTTIGTIATEWKDQKQREKGFDANIFDSLDFKNRAADSDHAEDGEITTAELKLLKHVGEDLARMGRVKRVTLGAQQKLEFLTVWSKRRTR